MEHLTEPSILQDASLNACCDAASIDMTTSSNTENVVSLVPIMSQGDNSAVLGNRESIASTQLVSNEEVSKQTDSNSNSKNLAPISQSICTYFLKGSCLRINCRFFHGTEEQLGRKMKMDAERGASGDEDHHASSNTETLTARGKKPIVCLSYLSGTCTRTNCRFIHLPDHVRPVPNAVCTATHCRRNQCRFFHGTREQLDDLQVRGHSFYNPVTFEGYRELPDLKEVPHAPPPPQQVPPMLMPQYNMPPQQVPHQSVVAPPLNFIPQQHVVPPPPQGAPVQQMFNPSQPQMINQPPTSHPQYVQLPPQPHHHQPLLQHPQQLPPPPQPQQQPQQQQQQQQQQQVMYVMNQQQPNGMPQHPPAPQQLQPPQSAPQQLPTMAPGSSFMPPPPQQQGAPLYQYPQQ